MRNGFFGVKNAHFAPVEDEDALTYKTPTHVAGTESQSAWSRPLRLATSYADNEVWLDKQQDNGGSGTMSFYDTESTPELQRPSSQRPRGLRDRPGRANYPERRPHAQEVRLHVEQPGHAPRSPSLPSCASSKPTQELNTTQDTPRDHAARLPVHVATRHHPEHRHSHERL